MTTQISYTGLIIEDDLDCAFCLGLLLRTLHIAPLITYSTTQALKILSDDTPIHFILCDLRFSNSDKDGFFFLQKYKQLFKSRVPVIVTSGVKDLALIKEAFLLGAQEYLIKPIELELLEELLTKFGFISPSRTP